MPKRKPSKPYDGVLAAPIKYDPEKSGLVNIAQWLKISAQKMNALFERYAIDRDDPDKWFWLSVNLATEHVPNFALPKARQGRPLTARQAALDTLLLFLIEHRGKSSVKKKVKDLTKNHPKFKGKDPGTLRERYYKLKNPKTHRSTNSSSLSALKI